MKRLKPMNKKAHQLSQASDEGKKQEVFAMQVVAVGFVIGVIQDSAETALNSSTDVVFTAACSQAADK